MNIKGKQVEIRDIQHINYDDYRSYPAKNQSLLKQIYDDPTSVDQEKEQTAGMYLGSAVDALIFETFDSEYIKGTKVDPSDSIKSVLNYCYMVDSKELADETILEGAKEFNYGQSWKPLTLITKVREGGNKGTNDGELYFDFLKRAKGKTVIAHEDYDQAKFIANTIQDIDAQLLHTGKFQQAFVGKLYVNNKFICEVKALFDLLHNESVIDYKVIGTDARWFVYTHFLKFRYYLQSSLYYLFAEALFGEVADFKFRVIHKDYPQYPVFYNTDNDIIEKGIIGFERNGRYYPGLLDLIDLAKKQEVIGYKAPYSIVNNESFDISL